MLNLISICATSEKKINGNYWWTNQPTDSNKAICSSFFGWGHNNVAVNINSVINVYSTTLCRSILLLNSVTLLLMII